MKKIATFITFCALCFSGMQLHAQDTGAGAMNGVNQGAGEWSWGIGLVSLAALGTVIGLVVSSATDNPVTFSHN